MKIDCDATQVLKTALNQMYICFVFHFSFFLFKYPRFEISGVNECSTKTNAQDLASSLR